MMSGANDPAPAEDLLNENPSLVGLGKNRPSNPVMRLIMFFDY